MTSNGDAVGKAMGRLHHSVRTTYPNLALPLAPLPRDRHELRRAHTGARSEAITIAYL